MKTQDPMSPVPAFWPDAPGEWERMHERLAAKAKAEQPRIVFLGDSITQGWDSGIWREKWAPLGAVNLGIGGDQTQQILWRIENGALDDISPRLIVLLIGINNLWSMEWSADEVAAGIRRIVEQIEVKCPAARVLLLGILPAQIQPDAPLRLLLQEVNEHIARLDDGRRVRFLDIGGHLLEPDGVLSPTVAPDGCHLSAEGYRRFAEAIEPLVRELASAADEPQ